MEVSDALWAGLIAGIVIATQFGAVSALLVDAAVRAGPRAGAAAGLGVASVDLAYTAGAVGAGGAARAGLAAHQSEVKAAAAVILALVGVHGLWALARTRPHDQQTQALHEVPRPLAAPSAQYLRFVGLTAINPLTLVYFASVTASLSLAGVAADVAFVAGVGTASALWHLSLSLAAGHAGRQFTPTIQRVVSVAGRVAVVVMAIRLAIAI